MRVEFLIEGISERVTAGMKAAEARGRHLGRPGTPPRVVSEIEALATTTDLSIRAIQKKIAGRASRGVTGAKPRAKTNRIPIYITKRTKKAAYIQCGRVTDPL